MYTHIFMLRKVIIGGYRRSLPEIIVDSMVVFNPDETGPEILLLIKLNVYNDIPDEIKDKLNSINCMKLRRRYNTDIFGVFNIKSEVELSSEEIECYIKYLSDSDWEDFYKKARVSI